MEGLVGTSWREETSPGLGPRPEKVGYLTGGRVGLCGEEGKAQRAATVCDWHLQGQSDSRLASTPGRSCVEREDWLVSEKGTRAR